MEEYGTETAKQGEGKVDIELCETLSLRVEDLLHNGAERDSGVQWGKIVIRSTHHEHGSQVRGGDNKCSDCWVIRHLCLVFGLGQVQKRNEERTNHL
jgi:hypothetical protein